MSGSDAQVAADYKLFPKHSIGLRGVVGVIDVPGLIRPGDRVVLEIPKSTVNVQGVLG